VSENKKNRDSSPYTEINTDDQLRNKVSYEEETKDSYSQIRRSQAEKRSHDLE
jgi:hypothetical protein